MIDRYLLRYFLAVLDLGSFSKAARQLNVSQPSLSVGIAKLERLLGASLFHRSSQRVHLTEAGSRLGVYARRIENEFNLAEAAFLDLKPARSLRLGVVSSYPNSHLSAIVRSTTQGLESLDSPLERERLEIVAGNERELQQRLARGQIDVALTIVRPDTDRFAHERLFTEGYALAMSSAHPLADRPAIPGEELADNPMIVRRHCEVLSETSRYFTERGVRPFFAFRSTNDDQVMSLVQAGLGVTVMPAGYQNDGVRRPLLSGFTLQRTIGLVYAAHAEHWQREPSRTLQAIRQRHR